tara:strand:- start:608 stop:730 length:123 start_codon:yes stop_codon:yes gene_type:complete
MSNQNMSVQYVKNLFTMTNIIVVGNVEMQIYDEENNKRNN